MHFTCLRFSRCKNFGCLCLAFLSKSLIEALDAVFPRPKGTTTDDNKNTRDYYCHRQPTPIPNDTHCGKNLFLLIQKIKQDWKWKSQNLNRIVAWNAIAALVAIVKLIAVKKSWVCHIKKYPIRIKFHTLVYPWVTTKRHFLSASRTKKVG